MVQGREYKLKWTNVLQLPPSFSFEVQKSEYAQVYREDDKYVLDILSHEYSQMK